MENRSQRIVKVFNGLNKDSMGILKDFYDENATFEDPLGKLNGLKSITAYYAGLYKNVSSIRFEFSKEVIQGDTHVVTWLMIMRVKGLNGGEEIRLNGTSWIEFNPKSDKAIYHRDYFDMGEMIYENLPVLKHVIRAIKSKLSHKD